MSRPIGITLIPAGFDDDAGKTLKVPISFPTPMSHVLTVEFVHALNDALQQLADPAVVNLAGDGDPLDALSPEHGLEGYGVFTLVGEAGEFPDR